MIESEEIEAQSEELGVSIANVERDYVFGWLLAGLFHADNELRYRLILKGGNAFRKAYFRDARFSKDLDFSIEEAFDANAFNHGVRQACEFVADMTGIEFDFERQNVKLKRGADTDQQSFESRVYFKGFYGEEECTISAKLDIKEFDRIFLPVQERPLVHAYSDTETCVASVRTMKLEELLANKLKALLQRDHSPDLFDFVYAVFVQNALAIDRLQLGTTFLRKTIYERQPFAAYEQLVKRPLAVIREAWSKYLVLPKPSVVTFERAEELFRSGIEALFILVGIEPRRATAYATQASLDYFTADRRSLIMDAGRLKRLLEVTYKGYTRVVRILSRTSAARMAWLGSISMFMIAPAGQAASRASRRSRMTISRRCGCSMRRLNRGTRSNSRRLVNTLGAPRSRATSAGQGSPVASAPVGLGRSSVSPPPSQSRTCSSARCARRSSVVSRCATRR